MNMSIFHEVSSPVLPALFTSSPRFLQIETPTSFGLAFDHFSLATLRRIRLQLKWDESTEIADE
jgi:hypothetical protein